MRDLSGAIGVTITPFIGGETPNFDEIKRQTELLCNSSINGIFPCSSTGEYPKISFENKIKIMETVAKANAGRKMLIAGACSVSIDEIKAFIDKAKELKYDACLICPPYYYPLKQDEVLRFYKRNIKGFKLCDRLPIKTIKRSNSMLSVIWRTLLCMVLYTRSVHQIKKHPQQGVFYLAERRGYCHTPLTGPLSELCVVKIASHMANEPCFAGLSLLVLFSK